MHEPLLAGADVERVHAGRQGRCGRRGEEDGPLAPRAEKFGVEAEQVDRDEVVVEAFGAGGREGVEVGEELDLGRGDDLREQGPEPQPRQDVGREDRYGGALLHHSWW